MLAPGSADTEGPFTEREIDVQLRTKALNSMYHVWREGMGEWRRVYEVPELKHLILESQKEVLLDEAVQE